VPDNSSSGFMGVLVGALVVIALVVIVVFGTGMLGSKNTTTLKVEAPKMGTSK
jgi:Sec-independent protein translocase protein TatA